MVKCSACQEEFETDRQLHAHLKKHSLRMVEYYQKYFPRHDLYDKKIIKFIYYEGYDFNIQRKLYDRYSPLSDKYTRDSIYWNRSGVRIPIGELQ